jgi:hypothetical protein
VFAFLNPRSSNFDALPTQASLTSIRTRLTFTSPQERNDPRRRVGNEPEPPDGALWCDASSNIASRADRRSKYG